MKIIAIDEAERIASEQKAGTLFAQGGDPLPVSAVEFQGSDETPLVIDGIIQVDWLFERGPSTTERRQTTIGIALDDLRAWCAEAHGCQPDEIKFWFEA